MQNYQRIISPLTSATPQVYLTLFAFRLRETDPMRIQAAQLRNPDFTVMDNNFWNNVKNQSLFRTRSTISVSTYVSTANVTAQFNVPLVDLDESVYGLYQIAPPPVRMGDLRITGADLEREKPRLLDEANSIAQNCFPEVKRVTRTGPAPGLTSPVLGSAALRPRSGPGAGARTGTRPER